MVCFCTDFRLFELKSSSCLRYFRLIKRIPQNMRPKSPAIYHDLSWCSSLMPFWSILTVSDHVIGKRNIRSSVPSYIFVRHFWISCHHAQDKACKTVDHEDTINKYLGTVELWKACGGSSRNCCQLSAPGLKTPLLKGFLKTCGPERNRRHVTIMFNTKKRPNRSSRELFHMEMGENYPLQIDGLML